MKEAGTMILIRQVQILLLTSCVFVDENEDETPKPSPKKLKKKKESNDAGREHKHPEFATIFMWIIEF